jgi:hypothetical protein
MTIAQRGVTAFNNVAGTNTFGPDRWLLYGSTANRISIIQSTVAPTGFTNSTLITSLGVTSPGSGDYYGLRHYIEGSNTAYLAWATVDAKTVTLSFWVRSSITGTYAVSIKNNSASRCFTSTYTITNANSWEQKTITIAGDTSGTWATDNIEFWFDLGSGTDANGATGTWNTSLVTRTTGSTTWVGTNGATFYLTGVQLEANTQATPFEQRPTSTELALCQRYYYTSGVVWSGFIANNSNAFGEGFSFQFPVTMRATPTLTNSFTSNDNAVLISSAATNKSVYIRETCSNTGFPYSSFTYSYVVTAEL